MLNNRDFIELERRLWREGNPLADELTSTRDCLIELLHEANALLNKYQNVINKASEVDDFDFFKEWDDFGSTVDMYVDQLELK